MDGGLQILHVPKEEWDTLIPGAHAGYVSWEDYEQNQRRLRESAQAMGRTAARAPLEKDRRSCRD